MINKTYSYFDRLWLVGDLHWGVKNNSSSRFFDIRSFFKVLLIPQINKHTKEGDAIVFMGDTIDKKQIVKNEILDTIYDIFEEIGKILPIYVIVGNHDLYVRTETNKTVLNTLRHIPNLTLVNNAIEILIRVGGTKMSKAILMSWCPTPEVELNRVENTDAEYCLCHGFTFNTLLIAGKSAAEKSSKPYNSIDIFKKFKRVLTGDIHDPFVYENIQGLGTPYHVDENDANTNPRGIWIYDFRNGDINNGEGKLTFLENKFSPKYKIISFESLLEFTKEEASDFVKNSFLTILINNESYATINILELNQYLVSARSIRFDQRSSAVKYEKIGVVGDNGDISSTSSFTVESKLNEYVSNLLPIHGERIVDIIKRDLDTLLLNASNDVKKIEEIIE